MVRYTYDSLLLSFGWLWIALLLLGMGWVENWKWEFRVEGWERVGGCILRSRQVGDGGYTRVCGPFIDFN